MYVILFEFRGGGNKQESVRALLFFLKKALEKLSSATVVFERLQKEKTCQNG